MTASETPLASETDREPVPLAPPSSRGAGEGGDPRIGPRRFLVGAVLAGFGLFVGGLTPLLGGGENVVAARFGIALLLVAVGLVVLARRPSLAAAGLAMLLGLLLRANPFYGDRLAEWPWQHWASTGALDHQVDVALWVVAAVLALVRAYLGWGRGLVLGALFVAFLAVFRTHAQGGGMPLIRNEEQLDLTWTFTIAGLGAAALLFARGSVTGRKAATILTILGAALAATIYLAWFQTSDTSVAQQYYRRVIQTWDTLVTSADASPHVREGALKDLLGRIAPFWCMAASLPVLLLASLFPRPGPIPRALGTIAFALLALRWILPAFSVVYFQRELLAIRGPSIVSGTIGDALTGAGLAAWLLLSSIGSVALSGGLFGRAPRTADGGLTTGPSLGGEPLGLRPLSVVPYLVTLLLLLVALYAAYHPVTDWHPQGGAIASDWPWNLSWDPFWTQPTAGLVLGGVSILGLCLALMCRPGRIRAVLALGGLLVGMAALAGPDPKAFLYGIRPLVPPILLALAVAGATAVRGGRSGALAKGLPWFAAALFLAILFYPLPIPVREGMESHGYRSTIGGIVLGLRTARDYESAGRFLTTAYSPGLVILSLAVLVLALAATRGPGRRPIVLWVLFGVTLAYPSMHTAYKIAWDPLAQSGNPFAFFFSKVAEDLSVYYLPHALGIAAATADLLLSRRAPAEGPAPEAAWRPRPASHRSTW